MKNLLSIFGKKDDSSDVAKNSGILNKPGDRLEARVTDSNRKVLKIATDNGNSKYSATQYSNGTLVETKVTKKRSKDRGMFDNILMITI